MKYFTIKELCKSNTAIKHGIDNTPTPEVEQNLISLIENVLDPLREAWGRPIIVNSGYRSPELNKVIGGVKTSQHMTGQAVDIQTVTDSKSDNEKLFKLAQSLDLPFDQLIDESNYSWIHISYSDKNRRQILHL